MSYALTNVATSPSTLELSEGIKYFFAGLISQVNIAINTSLDAKIDKLNQGLAKCSRNYNDTIIKLEEIENGNRSLGNMESPC